MLYETANYTVQCRTLMTKCAVASCISFQVIEKQLLFHIACGFSLY